MAKASQESSLQSETVQSLDRMQQFDTSSLPQKSRLGEDLHFENAVAPADRLIRFYQQVSPRIVDDLPQNLCEQLKNQANQDFNRLNSILSFSANVDSPQNARNSLIDGVRDAYDGAFKTLYPMASYSTSKTADFKRLESDARATAQGISDKTDALMEELATAKAEAEHVLAEIRRVAAEQGVSQQAIHFETEAAQHASDAKQWLKVTVWAAGALLIWAVSGLFLHKWEVLKPTSGYESVQYAISKVLIFGVMSSAVYLSAKNFLSHKHNAIVNKHRQNALMTYRALVEASDLPANRDIVLAQAAACIFSPQQTGYTGGRGVDGATAKSVVELLGKPIAMSE